jgi:hypothetical protein
MANGLPDKAKVGIPGNYVEIDPSTYFIAKRMEDVGMLRPGQALQLAATLPNSAKPPPKKGKRK